jgi:hypothetical protein
VSAQADFGRPLAVAAPWASLTVSGIDVQHLSLFSLQFRDTSLEHAFTTATVSASFLGIDRTICFHKLWISALLLVPILTGHIKSTPLGKALWMGYICVLLAHSMLMHLASKVYRDKRQLIVTPLKLLLVVILTAFVPTFVLKEVLSTASYVEVLLLGAGLVMQLCTGELVSGLPSDSRLCSGNSVCCTLPTTTSWQSEQRADTVFRGVVVLEAGAA